MTWTQQLAEKLEANRLHAFSWLLNMVMRPWRDRELAYGLFAHAQVLKEYHRMVRMAEELLRSIIRDAARNIKFYEFHPPEPAKSSFTIPPIGTIRPIPKIKADFHFRMKQPFPAASKTPKGVESPRRNGAPSGAARHLPLTGEDKAPALPREGAHAKTELPRAGAHAKTALPREGAHAKTALPREGANAKTALPREGELSRSKTETEGVEPRRRNDAPSGAARHLPLPGEDKPRQQPDLTLIGLKLMCRARAVEKAVYQVKKYAWRYAYCQARRKLRARPQVAAAREPLNQPPDARKPQSPQSGPRSRARCSPPAPA
ncbi:MAG: hypothetical protein K2P95_04855 [Hyphomonadaceae bacterium]|nr:hypothetical protein [Hyphomonadaceae bacterium]